MSFIKISRFLIILLSIIRIPQAQSITYYSDISDWRNVSVEALDKHPVWSRVQKISAINPQGEEVRIYPNRFDASDKHLLTSIEGLLFVKAGTPNKCLSKFKAGWKDLEGYLKCSEWMQGCDNIFLIKDSFVLFYLPVGACVTNLKLRPAGEAKKNSLR